MNQNISERAAKTNFGDRLLRSVMQKKSVLVIGLDPRPEDLPSPLLSEIRSGFSPDSLGPGREDKSLARAVYTGVRKFCIEIIDSTADFACAVKPQIAFFEQLGPAGYRILGDILARARNRELIVIMDVKRGDIGTTSDAYARAWLASVTPAGVPNTLECDAVTLAPYLGWDTVASFAPYFENGKGAFVLCRTSNKSAVEFQDLKSGNERIWEKTAQLIAKWGSDKTGESGFSSIGAVTGATYPEEGRRIREILPNAWFLVPGIGAQGGKPEDARCFTRADGTGAIFNASRGVIYAYKSREYERFGEKGFADAARAAAENLRTVLWENCGIL
ncbi:MAG: orotidine-5'-phosphate decarboxylase [bacterium]|jgi:orotidine-5'-phosphate decarboxylase